jgi:hypothetical protein
MCARPWPLCGTGCVQPLTGNEIMSKDIERILNQLGQDPVPDQIQHLAENTSARFLENLSKEPKSRTLVLWEMIMRSGIAKLAAAAAIVVVGVLAIAFWSPSGGTAYALEQTLTALHSVRTLHMKDYAPDQNEPKEFWIECDPAGELVNVRMHMPAWDSPADGAKEIVWHSGKAQVWFKAKGTVVTVNEKDRVISHLLEMVVAYDPKQVLDRIMEWQQQGRALVQIDQPSNKSEPIKVTVTYKGDQGDIQEVMMINQATLLLESKDRYRVVNGQSQPLGRDEFRSYNQPMDPGLFTFENLPADVVRVDMTSRDAGLARGNMTEAEIAEKVAREFFEALIAEDYNQAGRLVGGLPGDTLKAMLAGKGIKFVRIVSIGKAGPHPIPATGGLAVPCEVEMQKDGQTAVQSFPSLGVRPVYGQPDRWVVFGGF